MRPVVAAFAAGLLFAGGSASATPQFSTASKTVPGISAHLEQVRQGCGLGWHRRYWRDRWGRWHWGRCVPNGYR